MSMPAKMLCRDECSSKILGFFEDLWLALVRKYKFPDKWVFFFGGSLSLSLCSLQIVAKQDTPHTTHYFFFFFYFSWLLFSLSETWKKIIVGWQNDCSTWKFGMEKDTLSIPFNNNVLKLEKSDIWRWKYWVLGG